MSTICLLSRLRGFLISIDYGMSYVSNESQFRFPIALQIAFAIATFIGTICLPESPRWVCITLLVYFVLD